MTNRDFYCTACCEFFSMNDLVRHPRDDDDSERCGCPNCKDGGSIHDLRPLPEEMIKDKQ